MKLRSGMEIPVDGIAIHASGLSCDESAMTGESDELKKENHAHCHTRKREFLEEHPDPKDQNSHSIPSPIILSGTAVQAGEGSMLVAVVGPDSCVGLIMGKLNQSVEATPL